MEILSTAAFLITLRETIEAALIVSILLAYLTKSGNDKYKRDVWIGTILALMVSIVLAIIFTVAFGGFEGNLEYIFEGVVMILAASVLSWMLMWMFKNARNIKFELHNQVDNAINQNRRYGLITIAFVAVVREGIETVLFLAGIGTSEPFSALLVSGTAGILVAIAVTALLFNRIITFNLRIFFNVTSVILFGFAVYLFRTGIHEFQEVGLLGGESSIGTIIQLVSVALYVGVIGFLFYRINRQVELHASSPKIIPA